MPLLLKTISLRSPLGGEWSPIIQWVFFTSILFVLTLNGVEAILNNFESKNFPSFRYEGLLFVQNAFRFQPDTSLLSLFFFSDQSTSFNAAEHPLYYFHNLNAVHILAGLIQYFTDHWGIVLFLLSSACLVFGFTFLYQQRSEADEKFWQFILIFAVLLSPKGLFWAPQNLFIAILTTGVIVHFVLLRRVVAALPSRKDAICFFVLAIVITLAETNSAILLCLISIFYAFYSAACSWLHGRKLCEVFLLASRAPLLSGIPIVASRLLQFVAIYLNDLETLFQMDVAFTHKIKTSSDVSLAEAVSFYADNGLTFFGIIGNETLASNLAFISNYYLREFTPLVGISLLLASLVIILFYKQFSKSPFRQRVESASEEAPREDRFIGAEIETAKEPRLIVYMAAYQICFFLATTSILFITGRALNNIGLSHWSIFDIATMFRAVLIVFPAFLIATLFKNAIAQRAPLVRTSLNATLLGLVFLTGIATDYTYVRSDPLTFKEALRSVTPGSDVFSNFDIAPLAIESESRVTITWLTSLQPHCDLRSASTLLKMYRVPPEGIQRNRSGSIYFFLAYFEPYIFVDDTLQASRSALQMRHCLDELSHTILYEDEHYGLYRISDKRLFLK